MTAAVKWYLLVSVAGWLAWPLGFRHLRSLPDRGYLLSRALGLLLIGYTFWILASLGLVANSPGGMLLALVLVTGLGIWQYLSRPNHDETLRSWLRANRRLVVAAEALFLLAFVAWTLVRAYDPALNTTEKPMELTFLNGIRRSEFFPPSDPWLAGYAISYYYFGYLMVAMLADLTGVASGVAFNLAIAMLFALTILGAYAVVYNMIASRRTDDKRPSPGSFGALLGPLFVVIIGNLEGAFELLRAFRIPRSAGFWAWLDIKEINGPLQSSVLWPPESWRFWWWWRASRVIHDRDLTGDSIGLQPIDEFPMFSFLLGDMHPHVLALPFVLLVLGLALNLAGSSRQESRPLAPYGFVLYALAVGALFFLNAWDLPIYLFVIVSADLLRRMRTTGRATPEALGRSALFGLGLLIVSVALYLPFYVGFRSQASGLLPNVIFPTRLPNFLVMFGPLIFILAWFLTREARPWRPARAHWLLGTGLAVGLLAVLVGLMTLGGFVALRETVAQDFFLDAAGFIPANLPPDSLARDRALNEATTLAINRRLTQSGVALLLTVLLAFALSRFFRKRRTEAARDHAPGTWVSDFALLLVGTGLLLTLTPEFIYLRDTFGQRLNTVFKFYYAAWLLFGIAAAYGTWAIVSDERTTRTLRLAFVGLTGILTIGALTYPALAIPAKANFQAKASLDGIAYVEDISPGDLEAIRWLQANAEPDSVVLEAIGGQYSFYGRVSAMTGLPTLLGWPGHELQWRGSLALAGTREADVKTIYSSPDITTAQTLLDQYSVTYIFVGSLERGYGTPAGLEKFERFLTPVYANDEASIYRADQPLTLETP